MRACSAYVCVCVVNVNMSKSEFVIRILSFRRCKFTTYNKGGRVIKCVYPSLSNVSNSFAVFCLTCLFQCLTKKVKEAP